MNMSSINLSRPIQYYSAVICGTKHTLISLTAERSQQCIKNIMPKAPNKYVNSISYQTNLRTYCRY